MSSKQNIIHHVADTAMHLLHNSYLYQTNLWPRRSFKAGWGIGFSDSDTIYYAARTFMKDATNNTGVLVFNLHTINRQRRRNQMAHLKILFDYTVVNELYFEDGSRNISLTVCDDQVAMDFTYTPKKQ